MQRCPIAIASAPPTNWFSDLLGGTSAESTHVSIPLPSTGAHGGCQGATHKSLQPPSRLAAPQRAERASTGEPETRPHTPTMQRRVRTRGNARKSVENPDMGSSTSWEHRGCPAFWASVVWGLLDPIEPTVTYSPSGGKAEGKLAVEDGAVRRQPVGWLAAQGGRGIARW